MEMSAIEPDCLAFSERAGMLNCAGDGAVRDDAIPNEGGIISGERAGEENKLLTGPAVNTRAGAISGGADSFCSSADIAAREAVKAGKKPSCASGSSAAHTAALT